MSDQPPPPQPQPGPGDDQPPAPGYWKASDGNWYPPQQPQPPQPQQPQQGQPLGYTPAPPPASAGMPGWAKGCLIAFAVVAVLGVLGIACVAVVVDEATEEIDQAIADQQRNEASEARDVELGECGVDAVGSLNAELRVTNTSSERSNYFIDVVFEGSSGEQLESSFVTVSALEPGQSTTQRAVTLTQPTGTFTCRIADVERLSDE